MPKNDSTITLTPAQARDLARLKEVGSVTYKKGRADRKGFNSTVLLNLTELGLVERNPLEGWWTGTNTFTPVAGR